jgi:hypothetical protein
MAKSMGLAASPVKARAYHRLRWCVAKMGMASSFALRVFARAGSGPQLQHTLTLLYDVALPLLLGSDGFFYWDQASPGRVSHLSALEYLSGVSGTRPPLLENDQPSVCPTGRRGYTHAILGPH